MPAQQLLNGEPVYKQEATKYQPPYVACPYGPLIYVMVGVGIEVFGVQFWFGRLMSLLAALICAGCVGVLVRRFTGSHTYGALAAALLLAQQPMQFQVGVGKADMFALASGLIGMVLVVRTRDNNTQSLSLLTLSLSACFLGGTILFRQINCVPLLLSLLWLVMTRQLKAAGLLLLLCITFLTTALLWLEFVGGGGYVESVYLAQAGRPKLVSLAATKFAGLALSPVYVGLGVLGTILSVLVLRNRVRNLSPDDAHSSDSRNDLLAFARLGAAYVALSLGMAVATTSIPGSNINYYLEFCAAIALFVPTALAKAKLSAAEWRWVARLLVLCLVAGSAVTGVRYVRGEIFRWQAKPYFDEVVNRVSRVPFADAPGFSVYPELLALAGRPYWFNDFCQYDETFPRAHRLLNQQFQTQEFAVVISHSEEAPPGYARVETVNEPPTRFYPVCLFVRRGDFTDDAVSIRRP